MINTQQTEGEQRIQEHRIKFVNNVDASNNDAFCIIARQIVQ